ncbi:hypothetical protein ANCCEY_10823 [Ancylostoma ceylanicum]|uniref:Uncharacterized protein n=1 Tax=Ancylostoma ceylanicum TaxID=53326 RepID=A0A0D6LJG1_9BILA|nr:hypothetical protein ANCCEY_10823 [Ancylostoma ceylanicum]
MLPKLRTIQSKLSKSGKPIPLQLDQIKPEVIDRFVYAAKVAYDTGLCGALITSKNTHCQREPRCPQRIGR